MKTNVIMNSSDRKLFGVIIRQATKTGFLNLSDLQHIYNNQAEINGWSEKRIDHLFNQKENFERIYYVLKEQGFINVCFNTFIEHIENHGSIFKYLKKIGVYKTTGARHTKTTWCNPYIWILAALELHPQFYAKTVVWLTDSLIINRIEAGNFYKGLTKSIAKFDNVDYIGMAKALNHIVFGKHYLGIRNDATQKELKELEQLERNLSYAIDFNFLTSYDDVLDHLRNIWHQKQANKLT